MKKTDKIDLGFTPLDELFMDQKTRTEIHLPRIREIPLSEIDPFPDHPFHVRMDADMEELVLSVKERGVISPVLLRKKDDGRYEVVSGHRRVRACELAGLSTVKSEIRELGKEEATVLMVDSNLHRSVILPSEKAFAYKMRMEAIKRQGRRTDLNSAPVVSKSTSAPVVSKLRSNEVVGAMGGESREQVRRYIRLTFLIPELLKLVDEGKIALRPAVELSYLSRKEQEALFEAIGMNDATPSHAQAIRMRHFSEEARLTSDVIDAIMEEEKPNQKDKIGLYLKELRKFIPESVPDDETPGYILEALKAYRKHLIQARGIAR